MISGKTKQNKPHFSPSYVKKKAKMSYKAEGERRWYFIMEREIHPVLRALV